MISVIIAFMVLTYYYYRQQQLFEKVMKYKEKTHYVIGYLFTIYLFIMFKEVVGFPSLSNWQRVLNVQGTIFDPNINLIPFIGGVGISDYLNIVMFIPLGIILPLMWTKYDDFKQTVRYGFYVSLLIEISQLFVRSRATDVNDLIMNTLGAVIGWLIYKLFSRLILKQITPINLFQSSRFLSFEPKMYIVLVVVASFIS
ncbi:VanZ family protein [Vagococcus sp. DIV0080]|uniref:VanZ family protein n=1 Tax=Candidatus Vagococcus giribetii TaxID=2230876 RepID=A0ABS3HT61_9ENTE|nr:VanZ family protein [Vagococcus sp. DIV0080]MBO0476910.1 VanZ family protein [Vagococcus sp. DIV0080]